MSTSPNIHEVNLLPTTQTTSKTFEFTASDNPTKHGKYWLNGIMPTIGGIILLTTEHDSVVGIGFLVIGISLLVLFCLFEIPCPDTYAISFNDEENMIMVYCGRNELYSIPYDKFAQLLWDMQPQQYCIFCCCGCGFRYGTGKYDGATVDIVLKGGGQHQRINHKLCIGREIQESRAMVERANQYYKVAMVERANQYYYKVERPNNKNRSYEKILFDNEYKRKTDVVSLEVYDNAEKELTQLELKYEEGRISIGSCCYVDCDTVYGVVIEYLPHNYYTIIDLFEKRQRRAFGNGLTVITDETLLNEVKRQYKQYLMTQNQILK